MPLQNSLFVGRNGTKKRAQIFQLKCSWNIFLEPSLREGSPSLDISSLQSFSPKVAAHPPRPAALGKSVDSENHRFVVENSTESHEGLPFFFSNIYAFKCSRTIFSTFRKKPGNTALSLIYHFCYPLTCIF